jgi:ribonuclease HII
VENLSEKTAKELREYFLDENKAVSPQMLARLHQDPRIAVRLIAEMLRKRKLKRQKEAQRLDLLLHYESDLWDKGFRMIAGVDEAGMAPLAGPVIAAAVILPHRYRLPGLNDSKKIPNESKRECLASRIKQDALSWAIGRTEAEEIDRINIYQSGLLAMRRAVEALRPSPDFVLVDARSIPHCPHPQKGIVHGDALSASIAAASIIAKTTRDRHMAEMDILYPGYGFASHKGYPTPDHLKVLKERGALPIHRKTFAPVRDVISTHFRQKALFP